MHWRRALHFALLAMCTLSGCARLSALPTPFSLLPESDYEIRAPENAPPEGYPGEFWVDKRGCEFIRTAQGDWVPRFGNNGKAFCSEEFEGITGNAPANGARAPTPQPGEIMSVDARTGAITRVAAPQPIPPSYVNVATFSRTANGVAARKAFLDLGYPIVGANVPPAPGKAVSVVLGPFMVQDALDDAVQMARSLGYEDATTFSN